MSNFAITGCEFSVTETPLNTATEPSSIPMTAPMTLLLSNPLNAIANVKTPSISVTSEGFLSGDQLKLFTTNTCSDSSLVGSGTVGEISTSGPTTAIVTVTSPLGDGTYSFYLRILRGQSKSECSTQSVSYTLDTRPPQVLIVTAGQSSGAYGSGTTFSIQVLFDKPVTVIATGGGSVVGPTLALDTTPTLRHASYSNGTGTNTLELSYTVSTGDNTPSNASLDYTSISALVPQNGEVLSDTAGNVANLNLPAPGLPGSISGSKAIVINTGTGSTPTNPTASVLNSSIIGTGPVVADGASLSTLTITLLDASANPISGVVPTFAATDTGGTNIYGLCSTTNTVGVAICSLRSTQAELKTLSLLTPISLAGGDVLFTLPSAANGTISGTGPTIANGTSSSIVSITLTDASLLPVSGVTPTFSATGSGNTIGTCSATNTSGISACTLTSTVAGTKTISILTPSVSASSNNLVFLAGSAISANSTITGTTSVLANGIAASTVTITLLDSNLNPVVGLIPTFSATDTGNSNTYGACSATNVSGVSTCLLKSTFAEPKILSILTPVSKTGSSVTFTPGITSNGSISGTGPIPADGLSTSTISITLTDANSNPISGTTPTFTATGSGNSLGLCSATNSSGLSTCTLASTSSGTKTIALATPTVSATTTNITFQAGTASPTTSSISGTTPVVADGVATSTVSITLLDANSNPISGTTPTFGATDTAGANSYGACSATNASGIATCSLKSTHAEAKLLSILTPVNKTGTTVTFTSGGASNGVISGTGPIPADGIATSAISIILTDANSNPVSGITPTFTATGSGNNIGACSVTSGSGISNCTLTSTSSGTKTIALATPAVIASTTNVVFQTGTASATTSSISSTTPVVADGVATSTVTITLMDVHSNPISGTTPTFGATDTGSTNIYGACSATNASGLSTCTLKSTHAETKLLSILTPINKAGTSVVFTPGSAASGVISGTGPIPADGIATSTISITLTDANANPVSGTTPTFTATGSGNNIGACSATNAGGLSTCTLSSTSSGSKTIALATPTVTASTTNIVFQPGTASTITSLISGTTPVVADGVATSTVTITLLDVNSNPISGTTPTFGATDSGSTNVYGICSPTNASGVASCTLKSTHAETKIISILTPISKVGSSVVFTPGNPATGTISGTGPVLPDGVDTSTLTITLFDANSNPVSGIVPTFTASGSNNSLGLCSSTSASGVSTCTLASTTSGTKTISIASPTVTASTGSVVFQVGGANSSTSTITGTTPVFADGIASSSVTITLLDANSNPVVGSIPTFGATDTGSTNNYGVCSSTNASGVSTCSLKSSRAESKILSILTPVSKTGSSVLFTAGSPTNGLIAGTGPVVSDGVSTSTISITLTDANSNFISGVTPTFTVSGSGNTLGACTTSNASGASTCTLASTSSGTKTIAIATPTVTAASSPVTFQAGVASAATATISGTSSVVANGVASSTVSITLLDANSNPISGTVPTFGATDTGSTNNYGVCSSSNASGVSTCSLKSTRAESKVLSILTPVGKTGASVQFIAGSPANGIISGSGPVVADGTSTSTVSITLMDADSNLVSGVTPTFTASGSGNTLGTCSTTNASGLATCTLASTASGSKTIAIATPTIIAPTSTVTFQPGAASTSTSTIAGSGPVTANGTSTSTVTITLLDANSNPIFGVIPTFTATNTGATNGYGICGLTNVSGLSTCTLSSTRAETKTLSIASPVAVSGGTVVFVAGAAAIGTISGSGPVLANGVATSTITITLSDAQTNAVSGVTPTFTASGSGNALGACSLTNSIGVSTCTLSSTGAGTKSIAIATPTVTATANSVSFQAGAASTATSTIAGSGPVTANGTSTSTVTITLLDANSNPVVGVVPTFTATNTGATNAYGSCGLTNASGVSTCTLSSTKAETKTLSLSSPISLSGGTVVFNPGGAATGTIAGTGPVTANGVATSTITISLKDAQANPISGLVPTFASNGSNNTLGVCTSTNASGNSTCTLASTLAQVKTISISSPSVTASTATVSFTAGAASAGVSTLTLAPSSILPDGTTTSTATARLLDANSNPVSGKTVTISSSRGATDTIAVVSSSTTDTNGQASVTISSLTLGTPTISAVDVTDSISLAQTQTLAVSAAPTLATVSKISLGNYHACELVNGGVQCWGFNDYGDLGTGTPFSSSLPQHVFGLISGVSAIANGAYHTCAIVSGGVRCWGLNTNGQLGDNSTLNRFVPVQVNGLTSGVTAVAAGANHSCAIVGGAVMCWGSNSYGQLGNNSTTASLIPVQVQGLLSGATAVAVGQTHSCALITSGGASGSVSCWGYGADGQLGNSLHATSLIPVAVTGLSSGITSIASGGNHNCAINTSGSLNCWGGNGNGQLGNNSLADSTIPGPVIGLSSGTTQVVGGLLHTCALVNGGNTMQCWGDNTYGQLGNNLTISSSIPTTVYGLGSGGISSIAAGAVNSCVLSSGLPLCWGDNTFGQLGNGTTTAVRAPANVSNTDLTPGFTFPSFVGVISGASLSVSPTITSGTPTLWSISPTLPSGLSLNTSTGIISGSIVSSLSSSTTYTVTGTNTAGSATAIIDLGPAASPSLTFSLIAGTGPVTADGVSTSSISITLKDASQVAIVGVIPTFTATNSGSKNVYGLCSPTNSGGVSTCTLASSVAETKTLTITNPINLTGSSVTFAPGSVSASTSSLSLSPSTISNNGISTATATVILRDALSNMITSIKSVSLTSSRGSSDTITAANAGNTAGGVVTFDIVSSTVGSATLSATDTTDTISLAQTQTLSVIVNSAPAVGFSAITAGLSNNTCAIYNGGAQCWGLNSSGQLGNNSTTQSLVPVSVTGLIGGVTAIANGGAHGCAIVNGGAQCWGSNGYGQLGNNSTTQSLVPVQVTGVTSGITAIATGGSHSCAIISGAAKCWGSNNYGQLGNNTFTNSLVPLQVTGLTSGVTAISAGSAHTCAIVNGSAKCWGYNGNGLLGNNSVTQSLLPIQVTGLNSGVTAISAGSSHTCAVVNGGAQCWGYNGYFNLGNNSTIQSLIPVQVSGLTSGVTAISAGTGHSCAIINNGVQCWGNSTNGQVGINSTAFISVPVQVVGLATGVTAISTGNAHSCAIMNAEVLCWGGNGNGQLGNNTIPTQSLIPVNLLNSLLQPKFTYGVFSTPIVGLTGTWAPAFIGGSPTSFVLGSISPNLPTGLSLNASTGVISGTPTAATSASTYTIIGSSPSGYSSTSVTFAVDAAPSIVNSSIIGTGPIAANGTATSTITITLKDSSNVGLFMVTPTFKATDNNGITNNNIYGNCSLTDINGISTCTLASSSAGLKTLAITYPIALTGGVVSFTPGAVSAATSTLSVTPNFILNNGVATATATVILRDSLSNIVGIPKSIGLTSSRGATDTITAQNGGVTIEGVATFTIVSSTTGSMTLTAADTTDSITLPITQSLTVGASLSSRISTGEASGSTCAIYGGAATCWGSNTNGQLGNNSTTNSTVPVQVTGLTNGVTAIASDSTHSCALINGGVQCWGANASGQLGDGTTTQSLVPVQVTGLTSGVTAIATGANHTCAIVNGSAQCWGANASGQLGNNSSTLSNVPMQVSGLTSGVTSISAGSTHTCAVISGAAKCWGTGSNGYYNVLGNGTTLPSLVPVQVTGLTSGVTDIAAGTYHTCAIANGGAQCWGYGNVGRLGGNSIDSTIPSQVTGLYSGVTAISSGWGHSCAIVNGGAQCWGNNTSGELGNGTGNNSTGPVQVTGLTSGVTNISAGFGTTCAIVNDTVKCWGSNVNLPGNVAGIIMPPRFSYPYSGSNSNIVVGNMISWTPSISQGAFTTFALDSNSPNLPAGLTLNPATGLISGTPTTVTASATYIVIGSNSAGYGTAALTLGVVAVPSPTTSTITGTGPVTADGVATSTITITLKDASNAGLFMVIPAFAATDNNGNSNNNIYGICSLTDINGVSTCTLASATSESKTLAITYPVSVTGGVVNFISNAISASNSSLSLSTNLVPNDGVSISTATVILRDNLSNIATGVKSVSLTSSRGATDTITALNGGNTIGGVATFTIKSSTLGTAVLTAVDTTDSVTLTQTQNIWFGTNVSGITGLFTGPTASSSCAIFSGGAQCWGANASGQLGNNSITQSLVPAQVTGLTSGISNISTGLSHSCAVVNGAAQCWGANTNGQLGNNSTTQTLVPIQVTGLSSGVTAIAAGTSHTCAIISGGAKCWGLNTSGQLGNNSTTQSLVPVQVTGLTSGVSAIAASQNHTCAIVNGSAQCWGNGSSGELGANSGSSSLVPVQVFGLTTGVTAIAVGWADGCAVVSGSAKCWGFNGNGQLGNNSQTLSLLPVQVTGLTSGVTAIAMGTYRSCAIVNGGVQCWGLNPGNNTGSSLVPVQVTGLTSGVTAIGQGATHSCALVNGQIQCWGLNSNGQLGNNSTATALVPVNNSNTFGPPNFTYPSINTNLTVGNAISWAPTSTAGLMTSAVVHPNSPLPPGLTLNTTTGVISGTPTAATASATYTIIGSNASGYATAALTFAIDAAPSVTNSTITGTGPVSADGVATSTITITLKDANNSGLFLLMPTFTATDVNGLTNNNTYGICSLTDINGVSTCSLASSTGGLKNLAVTYPIAFSGGTVNFTAGTVSASTSSLTLSANTIFSDGVSTSTATVIIRDSVSNIVSTPKTVSLTSSRGATDTITPVSGGVTAGGVAVFTIKSSTVGTAILTATDTTDSLTLSQTQSLTVALPATTTTSGFTGITTSIGSHTCAIYNAGVHCWGSNTYGQLGNNSTSTSTVPIQVSGLSSGVTRISTGGGHSCAVVNGAAQCWGYNIYGQLGNNSTTNSSVPVQVTGLTSGVTAISSGDLHTCAVVNGSVKCWGYGFYGQLGNNLTTNSLIPVQVSGALNTGVTAISVGTRFSCAVVSGAAQCWGLNTNGQLGNNSTTQSNVPVQVTGLTSGVTAVAGGASHTCAVVSNSAQCWGLNTNGQLGNNSTTQSTVPVQVTGLTSGLTSIAAGSINSCAIVNGAAKCWGNNSNGQLGNNSTTQSLVPVQVTGLTSGVVAITSGFYDTCAIANGAALCWGYNSVGQLGNGSTAQSLVPIGILDTLMAPNFTYAFSNLNSNITVGNPISWLPISIAGTIASFSFAPASPSLPLGMTLNTSTGLISGTPTIATAAATYIITGSNSSGSATASITFAVAATPSTPNSTISGTGPVTADGVATSTINIIVKDANSAGIFMVIPTFSATDSSMSNIYGMCSLTDINGFSTCTLASSTAENKNLAITYPVSVAGGMVSFVPGPVSAATSTLSFNTNRIPNDGSTYSIATVTLRDARSNLVTTSKTVSLASSRGANDTIAANNSGLTLGGIASFTIKSSTLGTATLTATDTTDTVTLTQTQSLTIASATSGFTAIAANESPQSPGYNNTCGVYNGNAQCWGSNNNGQLGNNSTTNSTLTSQVFGLTSGVTAIATSFYHSCAVVNGAVKCWGANSGGQLGNNTTTQSLVPVQATSLTSGVTAIATNLYHSCALINGEAWCWGGNSNGQLGNNTTTQNLVPNAVSGLGSSSTAIATGGAFSCVVASAGAKCWGYNASGQLGNNTVSQSLVPVQVTGLTTGVTGIAAGESHACAIVSGAAKCWGYNGEGELGNSLTTQSLVPVQVTGLTSGVTAISTGYRHTCAIVNGGAQCWGYNASGQLGNNSTAISLVPVQVTGLTSGVTGIAAGFYHTCAIVNGAAQCWGSINGSLTPVTIGNTIQQPGFSYPATISANSYTSLSVYPTLLAGAPTAYTIFPSLPSGLTFNTTTGQISGTSTTALPPTAYTVQGSNVIGSSSANFTLSVALVSSVNSSITGSTVLADGTTGSTITITLLDSNTNPVVGVIPTFSATDTGAHNVYGACSVTNSGGVSTCTLTSTYAETKILQITSPTLKFGGNALFNPLAPTNLVYPTTTATLTTSKAISSNTPTITAQIVNYSVSPALPAGLTLNASTGAITGTPTVTTAATNYTVTASNITGSVSQILNFSVVNPTATISGTTNIIADGTNNSVITINILDNGSVGISGITPTFSASGSGNAIGACTTTDSTGTATCSLTSTVGETKTISVASPTVSSSSSTVLFLPVASITNSTITGTSSIIANGVATSTVTITLKDIGNTPIPGYLPTFNATDTGRTNFYSACTTTNASGISTCTMTSTYAEAKTLSLTYPATMTGGTVTFVAGAASATVSTLTLSSYSAARSTASAVTATVTLMDAFKNPISGKTVNVVESVLAATTVAPASAVTNAAGVASFAITTGATSGTATLTANDTTDSITLSPTALLIVATAANLKYTLQDYVKASNAVAGENFGAVTAIDIDTMAVGQPNDSSSQNTITNGATSATDTASANSGAVFVYTRASGGTTWTQQAYIKPSVVTAGEHFGSSIAIAGDTLAVGSTGAVVGNVYIFTRSGTTWTQTATLTSVASASQSRHFGAALAVSSNSTATSTLVISDPYDSSCQTTITNGTAVGTGTTCPGAGAVYAYTGSGTTWTQQAYIKPSNAATQLSNTYGYSLAIDGNSISVGSPSDSSCSTSIINGTTSAADTGCTNSGAAFVYNRIGNLWSQQAYLKAGNTITGVGGQFGFSVGINAGTLAVGAPNDASCQTTITTTLPSDTTCTGAGAAHVFSLSGSTWSLQAYMKPLGNTPTNRSPNFGYSIGISANMIAVGAPADGSNLTTISTTTASNNYTNVASGAIYAYQVSGTTWTQKNYIKASVNAAGFQLGYSLSISRGTLVGGEPFDNSNQTTISAAAGGTATAAGAGSVFVYLY